MAAIIWQCFMSPAEGGFGEFWSDYPSHMSQALEYRMTHRSFYRTTRVKWGESYCIDIDSMEQVSTKNGERRRVRRVMKLQADPRLEDWGEDDAAWTPAIGGAVSSTDVPPPAQRGTSFYVQVQSPEVGAALATPPLWVD